MYSQFMMHGQKNIKLSFQKLSMRYQTSTPAQLKPSLFWDVKQRGLAVGHRRFGKNYRNHLQESSCPRRTGGRVDE